MVVVFGKRDTHHGLGHAEVPVSTSENISLTAALEIVEASSERGACPGMIGTPTGLADVGNVMDLIAGTGFPSLLEPATAVTLRRSGVGAQLWIYRPTGITVVYAHPEVVHPLTATR